MTVLRLDAVSGTALDPALASVDAATLARRADGSYVDVPVGDVARLVRALAFAGITAAPCDADLGSPPSLVPAVGRDLVPLERGLVALDVVRVRRLPLGEATAGLLRRRLAWLRPPSPAAQARCLSLLRGTDVLLAWDRRAWATKRALRDPRVRSHLRPVVFDRSALARTDLEGRAFARQAALGAWLFA